MKSNIKIRSMIILMIVFIISLNNISYGTDMTSDPQIKTRGLTFNTGISSDQIRMLKDFFRVNNYKDVPWGYSYDSRTKELVRGYQSSKGLNPDGIAGGATVNAINKEIRDNRLNIGLRIPYTSVKGDMIIINKSSNTLYFMRDGNIQDSYPVATGKTTELTPNGQFRIVVKYKNPAWGGAGISEPIAAGATNNPLGTRWIGISYGGGGKYGVHGTSSPRSIGSYASLGCVRMFNQDVENLYERVRINTPIWMGPESLLESYGVKFKYNNLPRPEKPKPVVPEKPKPKPVAINVRLNGENLKLENPVMVKDGTTYYPFREILESINAIVIWDDASKKATGILNGKYVEFQLGKNQYVDNNGYKNLPEGKQVFAMDGKTYIPIRNLMESLGFNVKWEQPTNTVVIENIIEEETVEEIIEETLEEAEEEILEENIEENIEEDINPEEDSN